MPGKFVLHQQGRMLSSGPALLPQEGLKQITGWQKSVSGEVNYRPPLRMKYLERLKKNNHSLTMAAQVQILEI